MLGEHDHIEPDAELVAEFTETITFDQMTGTYRTMYSHTFMNAIKALINGYDPEVIDESHNAALEQMRGMNK